MKYLLCRSRGSRQYKMLEFHGGHTYTLLFRAFVIIFCVLSFHVLRLARYMSRDYIVFMMP